MTNAQGLIYEGDDRVDELRVMVERRVMREAWKERKRKSEKCE